MCGGHGSVVGMVLLVNGYHQCAAIWRTKIQSPTSTSTTEAELSALCALDALWLRLLMADDLAAPLHSLKLS